MFLKLNYINEQLKIDICTNCSYKSKLAQFRNINFFIQSNLSTQPNPKMIRKKLIGYESRFLDLSNSEIRVELKFIYTLNYLKINK
jgi:hypothetical protein